MNKTIFSILIALACFVPLAHADAALGYDGYIAPIETGYVAAQTDQFVLHGINVGDSITAVLTWGNPNADLDLRYTPPGGSCNIYPNPDVPCLAGSPGARVTGLENGCTYPGDESLAFIGGQTQATFTKTVTAAGAQEIDVEAGWVNPVTDGGVAYHLEVYVNGVQVDMSGAQPTTINYLNTNGQLFCHVPLA